MSNLMTIVLLVAVLVYTVINYVTGKTSLVFFLICVLALAVPLLKMLSILYQQWKNRGLRACGHSTRAWGCPAG